MSESPIKRRPATKAGQWRSQAKKLHQSVWQGQEQHLGSIPEDAQANAWPPTLEDVACRSDPMPTPVSSDPATPSDNPAGAREQETAMAEIDLPPSTKKQNKEALLPPI